VDADYAGDIDNSRSMEGHIYFVAGGPVSWASKQQDTVALSTVEVDYMPQTRPINIYADNNGSILNTQNNKNHRCTKHICIKYHFTKESVTAGDVRFTYIPLEENLVDILTKPLPRDAAIRYCEGIGLTSGA
jgi:hypothetical protein